MADVVGLYLNPPDKALVLSVDEKSQIQALDRTQPGLPMKKGRAGTMTHDYKRNGTTTLSRRSNAGRKIIGKCMPRTATASSSVPEAGRSGDAAGLDLHWSSTITLPIRLRRKALAQGHPRFHLHFTPTSASWPNVVERFFTGLTRTGLQREIFTRVLELQRAIDAYLETHNADPKPFVWTKPAHKILEKVSRARQALKSQH